MNPELSSGWYLSLVGWPVWCVVPVAVGAWLGIRRLSRFELAARSERQRKGLLALRGAAVVLMLMLLLEPIFSRRHVIEQLPTVTVLVDTSGSMSVRDTAMASSQRLDEAIALNLVPEEVRDTTLGDAARLLTRIGGELPDVVRALDSGTAGAENNILGRRLEVFVRELTTVGPRLAGQAAVGKDSGELLLLLRQSREVLARSVAAGGTEALRDKLRRFQAKIPGLALRCRRGQRAGDAAMVTGAAHDSPVAEGLARLDELTRYQRVRLLTEKKLLDLCKGRAVPRLCRLNKELAPLELGGGCDDVRLEGATDFAGPLTALAQSSGGDRLGGVLLLSDGRQTAGADPVPALRALRARGVRVAAVVVGDPSEPRDAAVAEILGSREVFQGETIQLDVRFRIVGYRNVPWDLVLTRGGEAVERRRVKGTGRWQRERFEVPAGEPGLVQFRARLVIDREAAVAAITGTQSHWACDEGKGQQVADSYDGKFNGRIESGQPGTLWQKGKSRGALRLKASERVRFAKQPKLGESWSFTGWFKAPLPAGQKGHVLLVTATGDHPVCAFKGMKLGAYQARGRQFRSCGRSLGNIEPGWHHLAAVGQGTATTYYLDGLRVGVSRFKAGGAIRVMGNGLYGQQLFSDGLDELRLHNRALTQVEVRRMKELSGTRRQAGGYVLREVWEGVAGDRIEQFTGSDRFAQPADRHEKLTVLEAGDAGRRCGARVRGFLGPKQSGSYRFHLQGADSAELWLSTGADVRRKTLIASISAVGHVPEGIWSKPIALTAGKRYYLELLQKRGEIGGRIRVGWKRPDGKSQEAIPGEYLSPATADDGAGGGSASLLREASSDNNQADLVVAVNKDPLRVLLVDGYPRWDSRYLMTMLERDRRVKLVRRFRAVRVPRGELELLPESQEELNRYSMVVFGDLKPSELNKGDQKRLGEFVAQRGGFLVLLAGPRALPGSYSLGGLADLLPVKIAAGAGSKGVAERQPGDGGPVSLKLTDRGERHPATLVLDDQALNKKLWPALPGLTWIARDVTAKPGAEVLLKSDDARETPIAAISRYGAGRVLYLGTDETWRWRDRLGDRIHQTFWLQAMRWGLGLRLRGKDEKLQIALARSMIAPQDETELRVRAIDNDAKPLSGKITARLQRLGERGDPVPGSGRVHEMTAMPGGAGIHHLRIAGLAEGRWRVEVRGDHPELTDLVETRELLVQRQPGREGVELGASPATLKRFARVGGHRAGDFSEAREVMESLLRGLKARRVGDLQTYRLWDNYVVLMLIVGLLLVEWVWRKRQGLP